MVTVNRRHNAPRRSPPPPPAAEPKAAQAPKAPKQERAAPAAKDRFETPQTGASTAPGAPAAPGAPPVTRPSKAQVKQVQRQLAEIGYRPGKASGALGAKTTAALKEFQTTLGIEPTGRLDARTQARLEKLSARAEKGGKDFVALGMKGETVRDAERRLQKLGYDVGVVDGIADQRTAEAAKAFKADQPELGSRSGTLGKKGLASLQNEVKELKHDAYHARVEASADRQALDAQVQALASGVDAASGQAGLGAGVTSREVSYVQEHLKAAGFDPKSTAGQFDERTTGALKAFQQRSGLAATGRLDADTWQKLRGATHEIQPGAASAQHLGERSKEVMRSERLLKKLGYDIGKADGVFDEKLLKASRRYEKDHRGTGESGAIGEHQLEHMKQTLENKQTIEKLERSLKRDVRSALREARLADRTLRMGGEGKRVEDLQRRLRTLGFNPGKVDGQFGARTLEAVKTFQASRGLEPTGTVDRKTRTAAGLNTAFGAAKKLNEIASTIDSVAKFAEQIGYKPGAVAKMSRLTGRVAQFTNALNLPGSASEVFKGIRKDGVLSKAAVDAYKLGTSSVDQARVLTRSARSAAERSGVTGAGKKVLASFAQSSMGVAMAKGRSKLARSTGGKLVRQGLSGLVDVARKGVRAAGRFAPIISTALAALDIRDAIKTLRDPKASGLKKATTVLTAVGSAAAIGAAVVGAPVVAAGLGAAAAVAGLIGDGKGISNAVRAGSRIVGTGLRAAGRAIDSVGGSVSRAISNGFRPVVQTVRQVGSSLSQGVSTVVRTVGNGASSVVRNVREGVRRGTAPVRNFIRRGAETIRRVTAPVRNFIRRGAETIRRVGGKVINRAKDFIGGLF